MHLHTRDNMAWNPKNYRRVGFINLGTWEAQVHPHTRKVGRRTQVSPILNPCSIRTWTPMQSPGRVAEAARLALLGLPGHGLEKDKEAKDLGLGL